MKFSSVFFSLFFILLLIFIVINNLSAQTQTVATFEAANDKADKLNVLYKSAVKDKKYPAAQKLANQELTIRLALPLDSLQNHKIANLYFGLASLNKIFNLFSAADSCIKQAVIFYQKLNVSIFTQLDLADAYRLSAQIYLFNNQHKAAEQVAIQSVLILERYKAASGEKTLTALVALANINSVQYKFEAAENLLNRALLVQKQLFTKDKNGTFFAISSPNGSSQENETTARIWQAFAKNYEYQGKYKLATDYLQRALSIRKQLYGDTPNLDLAYNLEHLALMETQKLNFISAKNLFNQSLAIYNQLYGENQPKSAISLSGIANVFRAEEKVDSAQIYFKKVIDLYKNNLTTYGDKSAEIYSVWAEMAAKQNDTLLALKRIKQGLNCISQQANIKLEFSAAPTLYQKAARYETHLSRKYDYLRQAFLLNCKSIYLYQFVNLNPENQLVSAANSLDIRAENQQFIQNIPYYQHIYAQTLDKKLFIKTLLYHIQFLIKQGQKQGKEVFLHEANDCLELFYFFHQQLILGLHTETDKLMHLLTAEELFLLGVDNNFILYQKAKEYKDKNKATLYFEKGLNYSEWAKSALLQQYWQESEFFADKKASFQTYKSQQYQLLYAEEQFAQASLSQSETERAKSGALLSKSYDLLRIEKQKMALSGKGEFQPNEAIKAPYLLTIKELSKDILKNNTAIIAYSGAENSLYTFQLWGENYEWTQKNSPVDSLIQAFYTNVAQQQREPRNLFLYQTYVNIASALGELLLPDNLPATVQKLTISPKNNHSNFPFDALLSENIAQKQTQNSFTFRSLPYWVKKATFSYVFNLQMLAKKQPKREKNDFLKLKKANILAICPSYESEKTQDELRKKLAKLSGAAQEFEFLQREYKGLFLQGLATDEAKIKQEMGNYGLIHFAGHAVADTVFSWQSKLILNEKVDTNLTFADEGFLQMYEVAAMQLNAELVFLSACETGRGQYMAGEGVFSLGKAFFYAGVPAVVMSGWNVNDQNTCNLVTLFYDKLSKGVEKDEALRQAKLAYLNGEQIHTSQLTDNPPNPCFWAGFNLVGDISPFVLQPAPNGWIWIIAKILGLGVAIFVFFGYIRHRKG